MRWDFRRTQDDYAIYLPALQKSYFASSSKTHSEDENWLYELCEQHDFLKENQLFYYPYALMSTGHINLATKDGKFHEDMYRKRDRTKTILVGDSGGYQIGSGAWPADWTNEDDNAAYVKRTMILEWMDKFCDYGITLDVPPWLIDHETSDSSKCYTFSDCVGATKINHDYWIENRTGACKFLNVLHGQNKSDAWSWYQTFKHYSDPKQYADKAFDGWSFGGHYKGWMPHITDVLVQLFHDGLLAQGKHDWLHFLGVSTLPAAVTLTCLQRALRKFINPKITLTFDSSSPFLSAQKHGCYLSHPNLVHNEKWSFTSKKLDGGFYPIWRSPICNSVYGELLRTTEGERASPAVNKLLAIHNCWLMFNAFHAANNLYDRGNRPKQFEGFDIQKIFNDIFCQYDLNPSKQIIADNFDALRAVSF